MTPRTIAGPSIAAAFLREGRAALLSCRGFSMTPWIRDGDVVELEPIRAGECRPGDVLLVEPPTGSLLCHRVVRLVRRRGGLFVQTKGDWLDQPDGPVAASACLGRVRAVWRGGRRVRWLDRSLFPARVLARACALASGLSRAWTRPARDLLALRAARRPACA